MVLLGCGERNRVLLDAATVSSFEHSFFADAALEAVVRSALGRPRGVLEPAALSAIETLDATERGIIDLEGIGQVTGLRQLRLAHNQVRDLTPLRALDSLRVLDLADNRVFSLTALAPLSRLTHLNLDFNLLRSLNTALE